MEYRDEVNASEELLLKVLGPMSNLAIGLKRIKSRNYLMTLGQIIEIFVGQGLFVNTQSVTKILDHKVSQICRAGSRFSRNCLCVALYGDTDNVMRWAIEHGALAVVTNHQINGIPCVIVESPELFYSIICGHFRALSPVNITAVAGSIGKTTTKRMITSVFQQQFETFNDPENENQMDCVGYICQHIPKGVEKQVQEVSEDTPGCMSYMSAMLQPDIVVFTTVDKSHIEQFDSQKEIYDEICSITNSMKDNGTVIVALGDTELINRIKDCKIKTVAIDNEDADFYATNIVYSSEGLFFYITDSLSGMTFNVVLHNIFAKHNVLSALYAFAVGVCSGESYDNILKGLDSYRTLGIRQNIYDSENGVKLYVDCYNAVAKSVESAIVAASQIPIIGKRIAVIGDVEEAGSTSEKIHKDIVQIVNDSSFTHLFTFGPKIKKATEGTKVRESLSIIAFLNKNELTQELKKVAKPGDIVLFKASRKSSLETIIESIWPKAYKKEMRSYSFAKIRWRIKVIFS